MRRQLGMLASLLFMSAVSLVGIGCSDNRCCDNEPVCERPCAPVSAEPSASVCCPQPCAPVSEEPSASICCPQPCAPECPPVRDCAPPCPPVCERPAPCGQPDCKPLVRCRHPNSNELRCFDFITVTARNPRMCILGEQYPLDFDVRACADVCDVIVTTHLPEGVTLLKSDPEARVEGRKLTWYFGPMNKGECRPARVLLKCECEGELCACFCATATPVRFCSLLCAKPILTCEKCGPEEVCPGDPVNYTITVSNKGSCVAEDVVVTDNIPVEMDHCSGLRTLTYKLGCLAPCESKCVNICLTACKRGKACNTAVVSACNADSVSCQSCTCICCCGVEIHKEGPKEVPIGKNADYQITVINTGDKLLTDVVVTDTAPSSTSIVAANGAAINCNQAIWRLRELKPGEKVSFGITLTTCAPGCFTNKVHVETCQGCNACAEFTTRWRGRPALNSCVRTSENPICIGERTSYTIDVINEGSEADSNVSVVVRFPNELQPLGVAGDTQGTVSGQTVTFAPYSNMQPRQTLTYRIDAEGKASGDARIQVEISSDSMRTPIVLQEGTVVN